MPVNNLRTLLSPPDKADSRILRHALSNLQPVVNKHAGHLTALFQVLDIFQAGPPSAEQHTAPDAWPIGV